MTAADSALQSIFVYREGLEDRRSTLSVALASSPHRLRDSGMISHLSSQQNLDINILASMYSKKELQRHYDMRSLIDRG